MPFVDADDAAAFVAENAACAGTTTGAASGALDHGSTDGVNTLATAKTVNGNAHATLAIHNGATRLRGDSPSIGRTRAPDLAPADFAGERGRFDHGF
ncbi:MAG: hypothetical protein ACTS5I_03695 [Rhodanobacter sp.]